MADTTFTTPGEDRFFEDYVPNSIHEFGPVEANQDELNSFVSYFDSQNFPTESDLTDKAAIESSAANERSHEGAMMRLLTDYYLPDAGKLSFAEIDEIHWVRPISPGDKLILRVTVSESMPMRSNYEPDRGIVISCIEVQNQNRTVVMSARMKTILYCLPG
ncbi:MAG: hypothetical protein NDI77_07045 [Geobacteraceae bacterium]|nr:hypothetical protein [Geobacteraceae bacterium]